MEVYMLWGALVTAALFGVPFWRILRRVGLPGALALLLLVPMLGGVILLALLAFGRWPAFEPMPREVRR